MQRNNCKNEDFRHSNSEYLMFLKHSMHVVCHRFRETKMKICTQHTEMIRNEWMIVSLLRLTNLISIFSLLPQCYFYSMFLDFCSLWSALYKKGHTFLGLCFLSLFDFLSVFITEIDIFCRSLCVCKGERIIQFQRFCIVWSGRTQL